MIETIILLVGLILGYFIKRNKPHHLEKIIKQRHIDLRECGEEKEELQAENNMLKSPKRLIKEYRGDDGSGTDHLKKSMAKDIEILDDKKSNLENEITDLQNKKQKLKAE